MFFCICLLESIITEVTIGCLIIVFCMFIFSAAYCDRWIFIETYMYSTLLYNVESNNNYYYMLEGWIFPMGQALFKRHRVSSLAPKCSPTVVHVECPADSDIAFV